MNRARLLSDLPCVAALCWLAAVPLLSNAAVGPSDAPAAPPHHLPRVIFECEAATGAPTSTCSAWIWHGASYSAVWSIGAIGQITVGARNPADISFQRVDSEGALAGLTATYTAKWDGTRFSDGNFSFTFKGSSNAGVWSGVPEMTPVVHTHMGMVQTVTQDEIYGVGRSPPAPYYNFYTADLSAFAVYFDRFGPGSSANVTIVEDLRAMGAAPMKPGERRSVGLKSMRLAPDYEAGAKYHAGMAIAAIYTDGATFGDSKVLSALIAHRRAMLSALTDIAPTLCKLGTQQASIAEVGAALSRQQAAEDTRGSADKAGRAAAYDYVDKSLHGRYGRDTAAQIIKLTWDRLDKLRSGLADPLKATAGQPAIAAVEPLTCNLP